jgi:hypothetical protein
MIKVEKEDVIEVDETHLLTLHNSSFVEALEGPVDFCCPSN